MLNLLEGLENRGHHVYTDNYYTSPALFQDLVSKGFGACGTVRVDRRGVPAEMRKSLARGEVVTAKTGPLLALKWMDKRAVTMLSSIHDDTLVAKQRRSRAAQGGTEEVRKPKMVEEYNQYMGGVAKADQLLSYYGFPHRTVKWCRRAFFHLLDLAVVQSYTLYHQSQQSGRHLSHVQFRVQLAKQLLISADAAVSTTTPPQSQPPCSRLTERHFPGRTEVRDGRFIQHDYIVCSRKRLW